MPLEYLQIPTKDTRYAYTTGRIRALELYFLKEADFSQMRQVDKIEEALGVLAKVFPYSESLKDIKEEKEFEKALDKELRRTYRELRYFCPEPELVDLFWLENDFYNLKVLLKIHFQKRISTPLKDSDREVESKDDFPSEASFLTEFTPLKPDLSLAGTMDIRVLEEAVEKEDFTQLPLDMRTLLPEVFSLMENNFHPRALDVFLDRKFFQWLLLKTQKYADSFLTRLIQLWIDSFNIKAFLRIKLWEKEEELLEKVLVEGGLIGKEQLLHLAHQGIQGLVDEFKRADYSQVLEEALEEWEKERSLFILDKFFDECILKHTYCGFYITFGREPLVNYIFLKKREIKRLRIILRSKLAGSELYA